MIYVKVVKKKQGLSFALLAGRFSFRTKVRESFLIYYSAL